MSILYDAITYISEFNPLNLKITVSREKIKKRNILLLFEQDSGHEVV